MTLAEFKRQVVAAIARHLPQAKFTPIMQHGIKLLGRVEIDEHTVIDVYFNANSGKTTYALVQMGKRIFGYDNFRGWHYHPIENPEEHIPCQEPTPDQALREMREILDRQ